MEYKDKVKTHNKSISLFPILLVNFIGTLGFSIVIPFLREKITKVKVRNTMIEQHAS